MNMMRYYVNNQNNYIGGSDGDPLSENEVPFPPEDARQKWNGSDYDPISSIDLGIELDKKVDFTNVDPFLKGYILAINDGSFIPGSNYTGAEIKAIIRAKM